jgi:hypothetical protein
MTATTILEILSILMLMLFALPGTQILWSRRGKEIRKFGKMEIQKSDETRGKSPVKKLSIEAAKVAASIF